MSDSRVRRFKILVVEDNPQNMELVGYLLNDAGFVVIQARDAEEARIEIEKTTPDLILMDMRLPGVDGMTLTADFKKKEKLKDVPIIALTAHAMRGDRERFLEGGCDGYISKPISVKKFIAQILEFVEGPAEGTDDK